MVAIAQNDIFVEGLYTVEQAAHLARLSPRSLRRWLDGEGDKEAALIRRIPKNDGGILGFVDLIQALAIRAIRQSGTLSLQKIRQTITEAAKAGIDFPFAHKHQTFRFGDEVVIKISDSLIGLTGEYRQQHLMKPILEVYLYDLTFDTLSGLATEWTPLKDSDSDAKIVINPKFQYGAPVVMPRGYTVGALVDAVENEGSAEAAADIFEIPLADVKLALRYEDMLIGTAA